MNKPIILIPAAGSSSRMLGGDKLLEEIAGEPLLRRQARIAVATGCPVIVTLPLDRPARDAALQGLDVEKLLVPDAATGMSASLRMGVAMAAALPGHPGLMILPADMPEFTSHGLARFIAAFAQQPNLIWRGTAESGQPGHPVIFPADLWPALAQTTGDKGGIDMIRSHPDRVRLFFFSGDAAITDLDSPEDWAAWRARNPG